MSRPNGSSETSATPPRSATESVREFRSRVGKLELRDAADGKGPGTVVGYAAVFDSYSEDLGYFREKIQRGAFADSLKTSDIRALVNHNPDRLIGRMSAGTLRLIEDEVGLRVEIDLPDSPDGQNIASALKRGDMSGQSFSFDMDDGIEEWDYSGQMPSRTLVKVGRLYDVGPVTFPAYTDTSAALRSLAEQHRPKPQAPDNSLWQARARQLSF